MIVRFDELSRIVMEPFTPARRELYMKRNMTFLAPLFALLLLAACGSDTTDVTSGDEPVGNDVDLPADPDDSIDKDPPADPVDPDLPSGPLGGGGTLATVDIVITYPDADDVTYTISCLGDTATIIGDVALNDFAACDQLGDDLVRDRLLNGAPADRVCTEIYGGPDVATITGTYDGVDGPEVNTTVDRSNGCGIDEWDSLLSEVLPGARGVQ